MKELAESKEYKRFLKAIKERIYRAQYEALKKVNKEHIALCWYIGEKIENRGRCVQMIKSYGILST